MNTLSRARPKVRRRPALRVTSELICVCTSFFVSANRCHAQPVITRQPLDQSVSLGASASFKALASSTQPPLRFQWRWNGHDLSNGTNATLLLTNIQLTNHGAYTVVISDLTGSVTSQPVTLDVDPTFTKVMTGPVVTTPGSFVSCAWGDYRNSGFLDLFITGFDGKNAYFRNNGDGTFSVDSPSTLVGDSAFHIGVACGDYDNDGWFDLALQEGGDSGSLEASLLYRNLGGEVFSKVPLGIPNQAYQSCAWADYDGDGFLDLLIAALTGKSVLFHNTGSGGFQKVTSGLLAADTGRTFGCAWGDYDGDGLMDLYLTNESSSGPSRLYHNRGNGTFIQITNSVVTSARSPTAAAAWGDYDNDGFLDLYVTGYTSPFNHLYRNSGDGTFIEITSDPSVSFRGPTHQGYAWGDFDNDGYLDLFTTSEDGANALFHNNGDGTFSRVASGSPSNDGFSDTSHVCTWVDYDNDGFLDLFVANQNGRNYLYHNNGNRNVWLEVKCVGTASNRSAIGTIVRVKATIGGKNLWQMRQITGGDGGFATAPLVAHFGLGDAEIVDVLRIEWPSGIVVQYRLAVAASPANNELAALRG
jgi:hypothetical protein